MGLRDVPRAQTSRGYCLLPGDLDERRLQSMSYLNEALPFDLAKSSLTFEVGDDEDDELMSTSSFSRSRIDKFGASSMERSEDVGPCGIAPGMVNSCFSSRRRSQESSDPR